jgi:hypothetical protein
MIETMAKSQADSIHEMRMMVADLTLGRESPNPTGQPETLPTWNERPSEYDYDSTPLSPGIEAVGAREEAEKEQERLLREREELQRSLIEKQNELDRFDLETSSPPLPNPEEEQS